MEELILNVCKQQSDYIVRQLDDRLSKMENCLKEHLSRVAENSKKIEKVCLQVIVYGIEEGQNKTPAESEDKLILLFKNKLSIDVAPNQGPDSDSGDPRHNFDPPTPAHHQRASSNFDAREFLQGFC
nr:unnamed protein product [Callosobruchus analis]